ncbi:T9SS type A sorting domain-containing protein [Aequorivita sp. SDUM287046]|uniref:T9SS type A sorting domain-containing protein n=1 Tax=Aequorivita aurantiaca TaxID=3053356 RepID=A0ABT8DIG3_9FLAO|nr:T9SS type A sorting domain-containing protein [Aequorivita aurantiaca]MDN3725190.1 T9SS type A sorting domain-containing protein [Aequorivita aurantiaca]
MMKKLLLTLSIFWAVSGFSQFGEQQIISTSTLKPYLSIPFDIDNDGFMDVLTASGETYELSWYRNLDGAGNFGSENVIEGTSALYLSVEFIDFDNDGDKDILYLRNNPRQVVWVENIDGAGNFGVTHILIEVDFIGNILSIDMDNDGDMDLLADITDTFTGWIVWYENLDGQGTFGEENILIQNDYAYVKLALEDIDNDGLLDILATEFVYSQGKIFWYKNMGNATFGPMQIIYQFLWVQSGGTNIVEFQYADINTDGKKDVIMTSIDDNSVASTHWLENLNNQGNFGDIQFIMDTDDQYHFYDLDNDADNDILLWNRFTDKISWKENEDGQGEFGTPRTITTSVDFPRDAKAADFDGDGWLDVASASSGDNKLAWYKNDRLGISENEVNNYLVFPNPTNGILHIKSKLPISQISVFNLLGQLIEEKQNIAQIDLSKVEAGVYLLKIEDENGNSQTHKIVKE